MVKVKELAKDVMITIFGTEIGCPFYIKLKDMKVFIVMIVQNILKNKSKQRKIKMFKDKDIIAYQCGRCGYFISVEQLTCIKLQKHPFEECPRCNCKKGLYIPVHKNKVKESEE